MQAVLPAARLCGSIADIESGGLRGRPAARVGSLHEAVQWILARDSEDKDNT